MNLEKEHMLDLSKVVDVLSKIHGVVGVILFGSLARGDFDEYSDYDLLVLFEDKTLMWKNWDELFQAVGSLKMNLHMVPETLEELNRANPVFLEELFNHGKVLFARIPLEVFSKPTRLAPFYLITYDMSSLDYRNKMRVIYFLYGKGNGGIVAESGGTKLCEGCILVPNQVGDSIINGLNTFGASTKKLEIYVSEDIIKHLMVLDA
jgi:predicted nucleotidyltransferase